MDPNEQPPAVSEESQPTPTESQPADIQIDLPAIEYREVAIEGSNAEFVLPKTASELELEKELSVLDAEYSAVAASLSEKEILSKFKNEYEKIFKGIYRSQMRVGGYKESIRNLQVEFDGNKLLTMKSSRNAEKDNVTLNEIDRNIAMNMSILEDMKKGEQELKEKAKSVKQEIADMIATIKDGIQLSPEQQQKIQELMDIKNKLSMELDDEMRSILLLRTAVTDNSDRLKCLETEKRQLEIEIFELKEKDTERKADIEKENKNKEFLDKELKAIRTIVSTKQTESKTRLEIISRVTDEIALLEAYIKNQMQLIEQFTHDKEATAIKMARIIEESKEHIEVTTRLIESNHNLEKELKDRVGTQVTQRNELKKLLKEKEEFANKVLILENAKHEAETQRKTLRQENENVASDIEFNRRSLDGCKKMIDDLSREKLLLGNLIAKSSGNTVKATDLMMMYAQIHENAEFDLSRQKRTNVKYAEKIVDLSKQRDQIIKDNVVLQEEYVDCVKSTKEKEAQIYDFRKRMIEVERRLKHQQALYEAVQNDRNIHSKHLLESQNEISQMKRKLKTMYYQINSFKEEIKSKSGFLQKETSDNIRLCDEIRSMNTEISKLKHQNELSMAYIRKQTSEESSLIQFLKGADFERTNQDHALRLLYGERDNLNSQVIKQNTELFKVYDDLRIAQSNLEHYELAFMKTIRQLSQIQLEALDMRTKRNNLRVSTSNMVEVKRIISQLEYELMTEDIKYHTMTREVMIPVNVHRWRSLENSNPQLFELIQLAQALQRKVIKKAEEEKMKEQLIQNQEKMYLQLRSVYAKQVGSEALEQIKDFQAILAEKQEYLRCLSYELKMYQAHSREHQYQVDQIDAMLGQMRKQYVETRMKEFKVTPDMVKTKKQLLPALPNAGIIVWIFEYI